MAKKVDAALATSYPDRTRASAICAIARLYAPLHCVAHARRERIDWESSAGFCKWARDRRLDGWFNRRIKKAGVLKHRPYTI